MAAEYSDAMISDQSLKEEVYAFKASNKEDAVFDETIGHIQDILLDDHFFEVQSGFMEKYCHDFEDSEENKFIYTDIFKEYTELLEGHLESELQSRIPGFSMDKFMKSLESRKAEVSEEIFDTLISLQDFLTFKQAMLDYKADKGGRSMDLVGLVVSSFASKNS